MDTAVCQDPAGGPPGDHAVGGGGYGNARNVGVGVLHMNRQNGGVTSGTENADAQAVQGLIKVFFDLRKLRFRMPGAHSPEAGGFLRQICRHIGGAADTDAQHGGRTYSPGPGRGHKAVDDEFFNPLDPIGKGYDPVPGSAEALASAALGCIGDIKEVWKIALLNEKVE